MLANHLMLRLHDDRVLATNRSARVAIAHAVCTTTPPDALLAFRAADTHLHVELLGEESAARETARCLQIALQRRLRPGVPFQAPRLKAIMDQWHLQETFGYILSQHKHHNISEDTYHEASNLPDLLGARILGAHTLTNMKAHLPRVRTQALHEHLGFPLSEPASIDIRVLADAAAAVLGSLSLDGRSSEEVRVRAAAIHLVRGRHPGQAIADALGITVRAARRLARRPVDATLVRAIALQVAIRTRV